MGFFSEKVEENHSLSMGSNTKASLMGGSWWWQNVKPFVNGGSAALLTELQFLLVESAIYYLRSYEKESAAKAFKQLPHLQNLKVGLCFPFIYPFFLLYIYIYVCVCVCMKEKKEKELPLCRVGILFKIYGWFQREEDKQGSNFTLKISECVGRQAFVYY